MKRVPPSSGNWTCSSPPCSFTIWRLTDRAVALVVKRAAKLAGLDPARYAGHGLRVGLATSAAIAGAEERDIVRQTRRTSVAVARRFIRDGSLSRSKVVGPLGL